MELFVYFLTDLRQFDNECEQKSSVKLLFDILTDFTDYDKEHAFSSIFPHILQRNMRRRHLWSSWSLCSSWFISSLVSYVSNRTISSSPLLSSWFTSSLTPNSSSEQYVLSPMWSSWFISLLISCAPWRIYAEVYCGTGALHHYRLHTISITVRAEVPSWGSWLIFFLMLIHLS